MVFAFFTDDADLLGKHEYTVMGHLAKYPNTAIEASATGIIEVIEPCSSVESVMTKQDYSEKDYHYGEDLVFELIPFALLPVNIDCPVVYSCKVVMGNTKVDLCGKDGDGTFAKFSE